MSAPMGGSFLLGALAREEEPGAPSGDPRRGGLILLHRAGKYRCICCLKKKQTLYANPSISRSSFWTSKLTAHDLLDCLNKFIFQIVWFRGNTFWRQHCNTGFKIYQLKGLLENRNINKRICTNTAGEFFFFFLLVLECIPSWKGGRWLL